MFGHVFRRSRRRVQSTLSNEQIRKRRRNEEALRRELQSRGLASRSELMRRLDIRKSGVTNIVAGMLESHLNRDLPGLHAQAVRVVVGGG